MAQGGRRPGAGRKPGSKNKAKTAAPIVADFELLLPLEFMEAEMQRFIDMKTEDALKEARLIAVSIMQYRHPRLAAKQVSNIHEIGDKLDNLLREINGKPGNTIIGRIRRPALEAQQPLLDHGQGGVEDAGAQESLLKEMHEFNLILKARQLGFTTLIQLVMLDACLFNRNIRAGTIAHRLDDARVIFRDKIRYPYDNLPEALKAAVPIVKDAADELEFGNNSAIRVSTSMRSGTLQYLHVSEYGQLCAKFPDKAREVRTGALNTVQAGQIVFIESTAEGREGHFYDLCEEAQAKQRMNARLSPLDFKFYFFPWFKCPDYAIDARGVTIDETYKRYFDKLRETQGIELTPAQKAWYVKKGGTQLSDMKREYPSTPEEAFEASLEGAYYSDQLATAELQGRVGEFPAEPGEPVHSAWDIGIGDYTSIWLFQRLDQRIRLIAYLQDCGEGLPHYVTELSRLRAAHNWTYGEHYWPHDGKMREWGSGLSRIEQFQSASIP